MEVMPRHQCLIYDGSPAKMLPALAVHIKQRLEGNFRCLYLNSPTMVVGMRSYLFAAGVDVVYEVARGRLILSSDQSHMKEGLFDPEAMIQVLEDTMNQALNDGYRGLWATGDMTWELGPDKNPQKLLEYEWRLEQLFQKHLTISGICQYHKDTLPREAVCNSLTVHPTLFINQTLVRVNPHFTAANAAISSTAPKPELLHTIQNLCAMQPWG